MTRPICEPLVTFFTPIRIAAAPFKMASRLRIVKSRRQQTMTTSRTRIRAAVRCNTQTRFLKARTRRDTELCGVENLRYYNFNDFNSAVQQVSNLTNGGSVLPRLTATSPTIRRSQPLVRATLSRVTTQSPKAVSRRRQTRASVLLRESRKTSPAQEVPARPFLHRMCAKRGLAVDLHRQPRRDKLNQARTRQLFAQRRMETQRKLDITTSLRFDRDEYVITPVASPDKNSGTLPRSKNSATTRYLPAGDVPEPKQFLRSVSPYVAFTCPMVEACRRFILTVKTVTSSCPMSCPQTTRKLTSNPRFGLTGR